MVEPDKTDLYHSADLEDTVRNLREENAKLLQLLRSQGLLPDNQNEKTNTSISSSILNQQSDSTNITFDHSDLTLTTNSISTTNQITHQDINNYGSTNQQNYNEQTIHGSQSNITPNFNTVIQTTTQPFVQNNSNTLVQNNTNLIQPINLVNFNNVSLDSLQSFFASQNNLVYLSQTSSTTSTTTTTTTTTSSSTNSNINDTLTSSTQSILPPAPSEQQHQISIRPKPSLIHPHQELVPVVPKIRPEHYENLSRHLSSSSSVATSSPSTTNNDATNSLDIDSNDPKHKHPRPIRPKPSSRSNSLQVYKSVVVNENRSSPTTNVLTPSSSFTTNNPSPTVSLFSSPTYSSPSSTSNYLTKDSQMDMPPQLLHSQSLDLSIPSTNNILSSTSLPNNGNKKSNKNRIRNRKKVPASSVIVPSTSQTLVPIAPNTGRPLAPAPVNIQRTLTSNNPITKRSTTNKKSVKRNSKTLVQYHSESILQQNSSSPSNSFAESISGLLENFDQELLASNFLPPPSTPLQTTTSNLLSDENNSIISSNSNVVQTLDNLDLQQLVNNTVQNHESYHVTTASMPTLDEFNDRLDSDTNLPHLTTQDFNVENDQITSFMNEEDMRLVEMNFDENTFLKQFDLDDPGIKLTAHSDQNIFANLLTNNTDLIQTQQINEQTPVHQNPLPPLPVYPGSSLINNSVFTTVVPLGSRQPTNTVLNSTNTTSLLPEEGVQLTARHIEPSQVATYESVKYQDILDDLVMVTDQDALRHAHAATAGDPSIETTDFSFALLEATNEIIKTANIQIVEQSSTTLNELQYFYPTIEQEQDLLNKQIESFQEKQQHELITNQQPIVILEKLHSDILATVGIHKDVLDDSIMNTSITDLSSIIQIQSGNSPSHLNTTTTTELITPINPKRTLRKSPMNHQIDYESLPPAKNLSNLFDNEPNISHSPISDTLALSSSSVRQLEQTTDTSSKPCILFEPISSPSNHSSPLKNSQNEMIIDSGCLDELHLNKTDLENNNNNNLDDIEDLLNETSDNQYEIIENQGKTSMKNHVIVDNVDELMDQIEPSLTPDPKRNQVLEQTFNQYQKKYHLQIQHEHDVSLKQSTEQSLTIPLVKLKLNSIYPKTSLNNNNEKQKSPTPTSSPKTADDQVSERPRLKITIRTKLPLPPPPSSSGTNPSEDKTENKKIRKTKKKKPQLQKKKVLADQLETEYAGLTRFERPLAQLYRQQSPPTPDETLLKDEIPSSPQPMSLPTESQSSIIPHSGFIIDEEQTPPSSITSIDHKQSPPPLLLTQTKNDKLKLNYSHLFNYDNNTTNNNHDHQNNNTFITPPPEIECSLQQQSSQKTNSTSSSSYENYSHFTHSPHKKKRHQRKSSVTSSTSSKSLTNTDYAIDTQALEPVSPTPLSTSKQKHSQHQTSSSSNYNDVSPPYFDHSQQRQTKDHHSRKSSSSSSRSSKAAAATTTSSSSQIYQQSRSLSNHNYRTPQEQPPLLPTILPPPPPMHLDPYAPSYHPFAPQTAAPPPPFFNFSFPHPFLNPHSTPTPSHFHHPSMKYHHHHSHHSHPSHAYPTHQQQYLYHHPHFPRQQQYNNSNYMSSRDHHSFDR